MRGEFDIALDKAKKTNVIGAGGQVMFSKSNNSPEVIARMETPILESKGTFKNLDDAEEWAKKNLLGKTFTNKFTQDPVYIGSKSISEMLNEESAKKVNVELHKAALMSVPDFIEYGIPAEIHPDKYGRDFDVMRLYSAIRIDGEIYRVKSTVRRVKQGDKYYTYELQEMELAEESRQIREGEGDNPRNPNTSDNSITGAKLLKGVKKTNSGEDILPDLAALTLGLQRLAMQLSDRQSIKQSPTPPGRG